MYISCSPTAITIFVLAFLHIEYFSLSNQPCCPPQCSASYPASAMISFPPLTSPLTYIHSCLAGFWSGSAASVTQLRVCSVSSTHLCVSVCACSMFVVFMYVNFLLCQQSQQSDNPPKTFLKQGDHTRTHTVCRVMAQSIRGGSLSH